MNTPTTPITQFQTSYDPPPMPTSTPASALRNAHANKSEPTVRSNGGRQGNLLDSDEPTCSYCQHSSTRPQPRRPSIQSHHTSLRTPLRPPLDTDFDYDSAVRNSYYGRKTYPSFDPSLPQACPLQFVRHFEHAAQHNGLQTKCWSKRFNSCLFGRAEDWAFDECPIECGGSSWDIRKRQFLDWALLPAEQELRRQRLLRFYQLESDLSIDFVYSFEQVARGLRDYKEDVWVRKCIANLLPQLRSALFELWPEGLPVQFRDLRDSMYAVDWSLYEAASLPLKVARLGTPYEYEAFKLMGSLEGQYSGNSSSSELPPKTSTGTLSSTSLGNRPSGLYMKRKQSPLRPIQASSAIMPAAQPPLPTGHLHYIRKNGRISNQLASAPCTPLCQPKQSSETGIKDRLSSETMTDSPANTGLYDLVHTLSRVSDKERLLIIAALEKMSAAEDSMSIVANVSKSFNQPPATIPIVASPRQTKARSPSSPLGDGKSSRAAAAAATIAATAQLTSPKERPKTADGAQLSGDSEVLRPSREKFGSATSPLPGQKIRLRNNRPRTSMTCCRGTRESSSFIGSPPPMHQFPATTDDKELPMTSLAAKQVADRAQLVRRKVSSRRSDSALTTSKRRMNDSRSTFNRGSEDEARSPEFTIIHPAVEQQQQQRHQPIATEDVGKRNTRRFKFIRKLSHMLSSH